MCFGCIRAKIAVIHMSLKSQTSVIQVMLALLTIALLSSSNGLLLVVSASTPTDTDGDGLSDDDEATYFTDPRDPDSDHDGITDGDEIHVYGTRPLNPDTDGDLLTDGAEVYGYTTDPNNPDTDGDGLTDGDEVRVYNTKPLDKDTDKDGLEDGEEIVGWDVTVEGSATYRVTSDPARPNSDSDGWFDGREKAEGTDPRKRDTDDDGLRDSADELPLNGGETVDTDRDGTGDNADIDDDYDGVDDSTEARTDVDIGVAALGQEPGAFLWSPSDQPVRVVAIPGNGQTITLVRAHLVTTDGVYFTKDIGPFISGRINEAGNGVVDLTENQQEIQDQFGSKPFHVRVTIQVDGTYATYSHPDRFSILTLKQTATIPSPSTPTFGPDEDGDGIPSSMLVGMTEWTIDGDNNGSTYTNADEPIAVALDPDDSDPSWPIPILTDGPYGSVARDGGDGIHYKLGASVLAKGILLDLVVEDTFDSGLLPYTVLAPSIATPTFGPDQDGDGIPANVTVQMTRWTIADDEALTLSSESVPATTITLDPNDSDPVVGAQTITLAVVPESGPDNDGDGVPSHITLQAYQVTLNPQATNPVTVTRSTLEDDTITLDPDDDNADIPAPASWSLEGVPLGATLGPDADGDGIPSYLQAETYRITIDRMDPEFISTQRTPGDDPTPINIDSDDEDPNSPVPVIDRDGDGIPDDMEPHFCNRDNPVLRSDGSCPTDGSPDEDNWTPPTADDVVLDLMWLLSDFI